MNFKYVYRFLYFLIVAHMVHKIYCRASAKSHTPLFVLILALIGINLKVKPVRYDEDGDPIAEDSYDIARANHGKIASVKVSSDVLKQITPRG